MMKTKEEKIKIILKSLDKEGLDYSFYPEKNEIMIFDEWESYDLNDEEILNSCFLSSLEVLKNL